MLEQRSGYRIGVCLPIPVRGMRGVALGWQGRGGRRTGVVRRPTITPPGEMRRRANPDRNRESRPKVHVKRRRTLAGACFMNWLSGDHGHGGMADSVTSRSIAFTMDLQPVSVSTMSLVFTPSFISEAM